MKKTITLSLASILALGLMSFGVLSSNGTKTGLTTTGCSCHGSTATTAVALNLSFSPALSTSGGYTPGMLYTVTETVTYTGQVKSGTDLKVSAGTLAAGTNTQYNLNTAGEITHQSGGVTATGGVASMNFKWTAPASGTATFSYVGIACNGSGSSGDFWNKTTLAVPPSPVGIAEQTVSNINLSVFPNPVIESANISYELVANSVVSATLINVTGQVVTTFFSKEEQTAGKQNRNLVMEPSLAKGIYFVAINVNDKNSYRKIVVE